MERENQEAKATAKYTCWKMIGLDNEKSCVYEFPANGEAFSLSVFFEVGSILFRGRKIFLKLITQKKKDFPEITFASDR